MEYQIPLLKGVLSMLAFRLSLYGCQRLALKLRLGLAQHSGNIKLVNRILAIFALADGLSPQQVASTLRVSDQSVLNWLSAFIQDGVDGLKVGSAPGRPPNLSKSQRKELALLIDSGPVACGFSGACWRSPMIQQLILDRFGVYYNVYYISQLLRNLGFSYQKARFVSDHLDELKRKEWVEKSWPQILRLAKEKNAYILFGDEASFPQWGTLSYTWARKGRQPAVKTSGRRKSIKVFGLIEYFTGKFFYKSMEGRLASQSYQEFLKEVITKAGKHIIVIQDGAKYHTSKAMREFFSQHQEEMTVYELPTYSPDYNPIEKLWKKIKEGYTHLHYFESFEGLVEKVEEGLKEYANRSKEVLRLFGMYKEMAAA